MLEDYIRYALPAKSFRGDGGLQLSPLILATVVKGKVKCHCYVLLGHSDRDGDHKFVDNICFHIRYDV